jgi:hypothetical protein
MARVELEDNWYPVTQQAMRPALEDAVDEMAADARNLARQVAYGEGREGHYADQIEGHTDLWVSRGLVTGFVGAHKFTSGWLEHGTVNMAPRDVLRTTAQRSGLPYRLSGRRNRRARRGARFRR